MSQVVQQKREYFKKCRNEPCPVLITFRKRVKEDGTEGWVVLQKNQDGSLVQHKCQYYNVAKIPKEEEVVTAAAEAPAAPAPDVQQEIRAIKAQLYVLIGRLERLEASLK